jgi:hypothetical protein
VKIYLIIKKSVLMSRGFEGKGLYRRVSDSKDFTNFFQPVAGYGDATVG